MSLRPVAFLRPVLDFLRNRSGSLAVMVAVTAPVLLGAIGLAVDFALMTRLDSEMQAAADAAALGGAKEISLAGATDSQIKSVAVAFARENLASSETPTPATPDVTIDAVVDRKAGTVAVTVERKWTPFILHFLSETATPVRSKAKAQVLSSGLTCVVGLSKFTPSGVQLWKSASLTADGCQVYSNTNTPMGLVIGDSATLKARVICVVGGYISTYPQAVEPTPTTDCPPLDDPLAQRKAPSFSGCDHPLPTLILNQSKTLDPGVYCGGLTILGNSNVTLNKGVYIIRNGLLTVSGTATLTGENVGFYLSGEASLFVFDSGTTIDLTAPKDGPLAGLLFFEDRDVTPLRIHRIGSNNARNLIGTIYLSQGTLLIDANAPVADNSAYTAFVVRSLQLQEGPKVVLHSDYEATDVPVPAGLIGERVVLSQ